LRELDERRPQLGERHREATRTLAMSLGRDAPWPPDQQIAFAIAEKGDDEGEQPREDDERTHVSAAARARLVRSPRPG
jgi:hypothetical protein